jgi:hypothetical protein
MVATSKCREKRKEPRLAEEPEGIPPHHVPPLPPAPVPQHHLQHWMGKFKGQSHLENLVWKPLGPQLP